MNPTERNGSEVFLQLRWPMLLATAIIILSDGVPSPWKPVWVMMLAAWGLSAHLLPRHLREGERSGGILLLGDVLFIALVLVAGAATDPWFLGAFFATVLLATVSRRNRGLTAGGAITAAYALTLAIVPETSSVGSVHALWRLPLLLATAGYVNALAESITERAGGTRLDHRERRELRALLEIQDAVTSTLDVRHVMRMIVDRVGQHVRAERCSILLVEGKRQNCFVVAASDNPEADMLEVDLSKYPEVRKALDTREPVVIRDIKNDPLVEQVRSTLVERGYRSLLVLPLVFGKEVLGTLFLRATRGHPFSAAEIRFCKVAAGASANALKNALLYRDVSRRAAQHRETWEKLRRVLDCSPDMIIATDNDGRITEFNRGAELLSGVDAGEAWKRELADILGGEVRAVMASGSDAPGPDRLDLVVPRRGGSEAQVSMISAPLTHQDGESAGRVWVGRDVTHQRRVEQSLAQTERLSSIGELAAGVAHELNNPLSGVLGYAQLLQASSEDEAQIHDLERIVDSAKRCQRIVHNLLSFARKHPLEKKLQDLNACVQKVLDLKAYHLRASNVQVELELAENLPRTLFDFHQLEQVVLNLLSNAEQAITAVGRSGVITIRTRRDQHSVVLEVEDDGPGVPESIHKKVFDPFFTTKEPGKGTGLGLSVSYGILQEHGGRIELVRGANDRGACFRVSLPLADSRETREPVEERPASLGAGLLRGRRILVAEDEPVVCQLLSRLLTEDGADVTLACDGQEAWEKIAVADFDLVVADLRMPNLDGRGLYERVAAERPEMVRRFVFATGDLVRQETVRFLERLPNRILAKPLDLETVRRVLHQALIPRV